MTIVRQGALTLVAPIIPGREASVDAWLRDAERELQRSLHHSTTTHFARWVVLPPSLDDAGHAIGGQSLLAFESNFDGELSDHVADLCACLGARLDDSFRHVEGYPGRDDLRELVQFFRAASLRSALYYSAHGGLSVPVVRADAELRRAVEARLDERALGAKVRAESALDLARDLQRVARGLAAERGFTLGAIERGLSTRPTSVWARALGRPFSVLLAFLLAPYFELREARARSRTPRADPLALRARRDLIGAQEDRVGQNGLTHLVAPKPGWYRRFSLRVMVYLVTALAEAGAVTGRLGGTQSIHFARWVALPDRRLLFFSNYDGSWEAHVGELIDKAARGLTMVGAQTAGFPQARWSLFGGAKDEAQFKAWVRAHQVPTQVWYSAYPTLSVGDVLKNAEIRDLLGRELSMSGAEKLLQLL